jgi:hypothetical protein
MYLIIGDVSTLKINTLRSLQTRDNLKQRDNEAVPQKLNKPWVSRDHYNSSEAVQV